jgi:hypothetical protein
VTEKVFNALLAPTIPIYFGASDIGEYVNLDKIVHCRLPAWKIMELRGYIHRNNIRGLVRRKELQVSLKLPYQSPFKKVDHVTS